MRCWWPGLFFLFKNLVFLWSLSHYSSMKLLILTSAVLVSLTQAQSLNSQDEHSDARRKSMMTRTEWLAEAKAAVQAKTVEELKAIIYDPDMGSNVRAASAVRLLETAQKHEDKVAAVPAISIDFRGGFNDWENPSWTEVYPVAATAASHPELMPEIIRRTLDGMLPELVVAQVLLQYGRSAMAQPEEHLAGLLKTDLSDEQRYLCQRLWGILDGTLFRSDKFKPTPFEVICAKVQGSRVGDPGPAAIKAMHQLLAQRPPQGKSVAGVKCMMGAPAEEDAGKLLYRFDDGDQRYEWTLSLEKGMVKSVSLALYE